MTNPSEEPADEYKYISIPFLPDFEGPMLSGRKIATSRNKRYGKPGERFKVFGAEFELLTVDPKPLGAIAAYHWRDEGCTSSNEFVMLWNKIHPRKKFQDGQIVYFHTFRRIDNLKEVAPPPPAPKPEAPPPAPQLELLEVAGTPVNGATHD